MEVVRVGFQEDPSISKLTDILNRHDAVLKCQFDAFAGYVREAEANGIENFPLYEWTKKAIDDPAKKAKYTKSFALCVGGKEVYQKDKADALEAELKPLVGGPIVAKVLLRREGRMAIHIRRREFILPLPFD